VICTLLDTALIQATVLALGWRGSLTGASRTTRPCVNKWAPRSTGFPRPIRNEMRLVHEPNSGVEIEARARSHCHQHQRLSAVSATESFSSLSHAWLWIYWPLRSL